MAGCARPRHSARCFGGCGRQPGSRRSAWPSSPGERHRVAALEAGRRKTPEDGRPVVRRLATRRRSAAALIAAAQQVDRDSTDPAPPEGVVAHDPAGVVTIRHRPPTVFRRSIRRTSDAPRCEGPANPRVAAPRCCKADRRGWHLHHPPWRSAWRCRRASAELEAAFASTRRPWPFLPVPHGHECATRGHVLIQARYCRGLVPIRTHVPCSRQ